MSGLQTLVLVAALFTGLGFSSDHEGGPMLVVMGTTLFVAAAVVGVVA